MTARRIKRTAWGQGRSAAILPGLACALWVLLGGFAAPALAQDAGVAAATEPAAAAAPEASPALSGTGGDAAAFAPPAPSAVATEEEDDDGIIGLIEAPEGAPGVPAEGMPPVIDPGALAASAMVSFAEVQPRAGMMGPVGHPPVVVELFTSQGCSSCPPADELLADLADREDVLALSWHVDYWDYLGWADEFARPEFTRRQQVYAHQAGERAIYTPQIVVGGTDTLIALRPAELMGLLQTQMARPAPVMVSSSQGKDGYRIELTPRGAIADRVAIILVRYAPQRRVAIKAGENRGIALEYRNVVLAAERIAEWDGRTPLRMTVRRDSQNSADFPADTRHAILAQELGRGDARSASGPILAAIRLD
ncbi:hypothetical protein BDE18_2877 [Paracoccus pantotrophus]|uniref:DUF1223 domain-containing protein n=1 Tax=Paracoccus pantotrophus TaxID=82367 RepID=A0AAE6NTL2_PARPN|nr:DUF1223 domain-containing protein [Paracoccus pantotrophus]QFG35708.1 DUF1223 domain-containing protein [Paracoccus pantotrophus]RKS44048.1 hypothetical protein BDE18_2877 [Paracoccus pantotrophus]